MEPGWVAACRHQDLDARRSLPAGRRLDRTALVPQVGDDDQGRLVETPRVGNHVRVFGQQRGLRAMDDDVLGVAQIDEPSVVAEDRRRIIPLGCGVGGPMVRGDGGPGHPGREPAVRTIVPGHRGARGVPCQRPHPCQHAVRVLPRRDSLEVVVAGLDVEQVVGGVDRCVAEPELLALVDERGPALQVEHRGDGLRGDRPVGRCRPEPGQVAGLVVAGQIQGVPAALGQAVLPPPERALQVQEVQRLRIPLPPGTVVEDHVVEVHEHVDLAVGRIGVMPGLVDGGQGHLADQDDVASVSEDLVAQLGDEPVDPWAVDVRRTSCEPAARLFEDVGKGRVLRDEVDDIHPEAVDPPVDPEAQDVVERRADLRVLPVEVGLRGGEQLEVVLAGGGVE